MLVCLENMASCQLWDTDCKDSCIIFQYCDARVLFVQVHLLLVASVLSRLLTIMGLLPFIQAYIHPKRILECGVTLLNPTQGPRYFH